MTVTLDLKPEIEAGLLARASATGVSLQEYVLSVIEQAIVTGEQERGAASAREEAVRRMLQFGDQHRLSLGSR